MKLLLCGALAAVGLCLMAGTARADSLVYIKNGNVWLANPDGSGQYQVTLDGTAGRGTDAEGPRRPIGSVVG